eukprot:CAMPEP_0194200720 /NCGR_PEP_ID=MMETSP0156-20130528/1206_1 /TAXON_ID=33649 /ORGANISM="Thalassionema nitzschioides, Strain L26-B" /LENGTH=112 /DNA_ID=CAMNT_0038925753 /DNA_START=87 /DNA_END=425 /DNA_ORIENTATION=-
MQLSSVSCFLCFAAIYLKQTFAFTIPLRRAVPPKLASTREDEPIECYVTNNGDEKQKVVCTSDPEGYAWFNGIDPEKMKPTDGTSEGTTECVEGYSPKGIPEWECVDESNKS